jgi:hypothetical protein
VLIGCTTSKTFRNSVPPSITTLAILDSSSFSPLPEACAEPGPVGSTTTSSKNIAKPTFGSMLFGCRCWQVILEAAGTLDCCRTIGFWSFGMENWLPEHGSVSISMKWGRASRRAESTGMRSSYLVRTQDGKPYPRISSVPAQPLSVRVGNSRTRSSHSFPFGSQSQQRIRWRNDVRRQVVEDHAQPGCPRGASVRDHRSLIDRGEDGPKSWAGVAGDPWMRSPARAASRKRLPSGPSTGHP